MVHEDFDNTNATDPVGNTPLTESAAAAHLGLKVATLRAWRNQGRGPVYVRLGRAIRYLTVDIDEFLNSNRQRPRTHGKSVPRTATDPRPDSNE